MGDREEGKGTGDRIWDRGVVEGDKHIGEGSGSRGGEGGEVGVREREKERGSSVAEFSGAGIAHSSECRSRRGGCWWGGWRLLTSWCCGSGSGSGGSGERERESSVAELIGAGAAQSSELWSRRGGCRIGGRRLLASWCCGMKSGAGESRP